MSDGNIKLTAEQDPTLDIMNSVYVPLVRSLEPDTFRLFENIARDTGLPTMLVGTIVARAFLKVAAEVFAVATLELDPNDPEQWEKIETFRNAVVQSLITEGAKYDKDIAEAWAEHEAKEASLETSPA